MFIIAIIEVIIKWQLVNQYFLLAELAMLIPKFMQLVLEAMPVLKIIAPIIIAAILKQSTHLHQQLMSIRSSPQFMPSNSILRLMAPLAMPIHLFMHPLSWQLERLHLQRRHHQLDFPQPPSLTSLPPYPQQPWI